MAIIKNFKNPIERKLFLDMLGINLPIFCRTLDGGMLISPNFITGSSRSVFNLGFKKNIYEVFGCDLKFWGLPVSSIVGDGVRFPLNPSFLENMFKRHFALKLQVNEGQFSNSDRQILHGSMSSATAFYHGDLRKRIKKFWIRVAIVVINILIFLSSNSVYI
ncbi:hypothetical protein HELRODRAFT_161391 [Helobdella robusta]|uniref:Uncharacterized protein n=1 Tax=Helobdella robusta TaxID=6412 RepID=T1ERF4_HELRO|nr:hypothetical protein HELRODRAFT_161391 [Helobdella robusta]ESO02154.1 hypothetical protein HELRODRAFT_161391 [Helobdella robusta]